MTDWRSRAPRVAVVLALLLFVALIIGLTRFTVKVRASPICQATGLGKVMSFTPEQTYHAATITAIAMKRGLPPRAASIALATALQESDLRNVAYGDRDSLGLFQQRPSQGWGTEEQVQDPIHATNAFYDALVKVPDYTTRPITEVAQEVQRSAYPGAYADHEQQGRVLASALSGQTPAGLACRLPAADSAGDRKQLLADLGTQTGQRGTGTARTVTVTTKNSTTAWGVAAWAVGQAQARGIVEVHVADRVWHRDSGDAGLSWSTATNSAGKGIVTITLAG